jgi:hypothetical protein
MPTDSVPSPTADTVEVPTEPTIRFGLRGGGCAVLADEAEWFGQLQASLMARLKPADEVEASAVEAIAVLELKLVRLDALELRVLAAGDGDDAPKLPSLNTLARYRSRLLKERWELDHRLRLLAASRCTNEAEPGASMRDPAAGRSPLEIWVERRQAEARAAKRPANAQAEATPPLNRHQRRKLAAMRAAA